MTDLELAKRCTTGDREAQRVLFTQHSRLMMTVCLRYADNRQEAEDMLQEGFIKVFAHINQYEGKGALGGWIRKVMVNTALNYLRQQKHHRKLADVEAAEEVEALDSDAVESMSADDLIKLISTMPSGYRTVFNLFAVEGYSHKEISEMMNITESTSKTQFLKARNWLMKNLTSIEKTE